MVQHVVASGLAVSHFRATSKSSPSLPSRSREMPALERHSLPRVSCKQPPSKGPIRRCALCTHRNQENYRIRRKRASEGRETRLDFNYSELISIAEELSWFPPKKVVVWARRTSLTGFVHELRGLRNYVHPGVLAPKDRPVKIYEERIQHRF